MMDNQTLFLNKLQDVVALAKLNEMEVTKEFIHEYFEDVTLGEDKLAYIFEYLIQKNIKVKGYKENKKVREEAFGLHQEEADEEESEYLSVYLNEISNKSGVQRDITVELFDKIRKGDSSAKNMMIEQKLERVTVIAAALKHKGLSQSDLIQEGNIGLLLALEHLNEKEDDVTDDEYVDREIRNAMLQALDDFKQDKEVRGNIIVKAERLKSEVEKLAEDFGDKVTTEDIAQFTGMDLEEIKDILRITGEEL